MSQVLLNKFHFFMVLCHAAVVVGFQTSILWPMKFVDLCRSYCNVV